VQTARPVTISNLEARDVKIRIMGDVAIIHARTTYAMPDGRAASGRYTDVWARRKGRWLAVSAHVTRCREEIRVGRWLMTRATDRTSACSYFGWATVRR
jgi:Domain of unknown function (DUF4440)